MIKTADFAENKFFICVTKSGKIKRTPLSAFKNIRRHGLRCITLAEGDEIAAAHLSEGDSGVLVATHNGMAICFWETKIRSMGRTAGGVRAIKLREGDYVVGATKAYDENMTILTITEKGYGRRTALTNYPMRNRGGYGVMNYKTEKGRGAVVGIRALGPDDDVILISSDGVIIRIRANDINPSSRYSLGVRVMRLAEENKVVAFTRTEHDDSEQTEEVEAADEAELLAAAAEEAGEVIEEDNEPDDEGEDTDESED